MDAGVKCKMFDILVGSILGYGAEVWGIHEAKDIEILHTKFCRWVLNVKKIYKFIWSIWRPGQGTTLNLQENQYDPILDKASYFW